MSESSHSNTISGRRHEAAARALAELGPELSEHEVLSVQCAHSHHVAAVYETPAGPVFRSVTGPHAHGRKDRADVAHHGSHHGEEYVELLADPAAGENVPGWCDCGLWELSRHDLLTDLREHVRTTHVA